MNATLRILPLSPNDVAAALRLSTQAGWNQLPQDWQRLLDLWPDQCLGGWISDTLVATGTLSTYGKALAWVGMILVDQQYRGRGFGGAIFDAIMRLAAELDVQTLGLAATALGQPVYAKRGFTIASRINRWLGPATTLSARSPAQRPRPDWRRILDLDRQATSIDRSSLLRHIAGEAGASLRASPEGFALGRLGRTAAHVGPIVATEAAAANNLVDELLEDVARSAPGAAVLIDVPCGSPIEQHLRARGFAVSRELAIMLLPLRPLPLADDPRIFAATSFEAG